MSVTKSDIMLLETYLIENFSKMRPKLTYQNNRNMVGVRFEWGSNSLELDMDDLTPMLDLMDPNTGYSTDSKRFLREVLFPLFVEHA
jgi:hypothetical protein